MYKNGPADSYITPDEQSFLTAKYTLTYSAGETANVYASIFDYTINETVEPNWGGCDNVGSSEPMSNSGTEFGTTCTINMNGNKTVSISDR